MSTERSAVAAMMASFEQLCRTRGLRVTHQRTAIFRALVQQAEHPTIEDVFTRVQKQLKTISLDTVYRTIATFEEYGLVRRVLHIDNATRLDVNLTTHHHLVCSMCNTIEDFYWPDFDRMKPPRSVAHWERIDTKHVVISGLCARCQAAKPQRMTGKAGRISDR